MFRIALHGNDKIYRLNGDRIQRITPGTDDIGVWIDFAADLLSGDGRPSALLFIPDPAGAALLAWWDQTSVNVRPPKAPEGPPLFSYPLAVPALGSRVRQRVHGPFQAPETYCGRVDGFGEMEGTPIIYVRYDDGNTIGERYEALEPEGPA